MVELTLSPNTGSECEDRIEASDAFNKYRYPEFAGWSGERYLKKLLRQILPTALYRTWEIFADHQAQGGDCYLGVTRLAEIAGRTTRTAAFHSFSERSSTKSSILPKRRGPGKTA